MDKYEAYSNERALLIGLAKQQSESFDKTIMLIAGGTISLTVSFLGGLISEQCAKYPFMLYSGWLSLLLAMIATFASFRTTQRACTERLKELEKWLRDEKVVSAGGWNKATRYLNLLAFSLLLVGLFLIMLFVYFNVIK